ncbi:hypothetical protein D3C86_1751090 [compost metagenome]
MCLFGLQTDLGRDIAYQMAGKVTVAVQQRAYRLAELVQVILLADEACAARLQAQTGKVLTALCSQYQDRDLARLLAQAADDFQTAKAWEGQIKNQQ